jgi:hypothetical protein
MTFDHIFSAVTGICEIAIWWMIWQDYRIARGKPELRMPTKKWVLMIALSLIPLGVLIYARGTTSPVESNSTPRGEIPEFDTPNSTIVTAWAQDSPNSCSMDVNGNALLSRQLGYRLAIACFIYDGRTDILDAPYLQVSNLYDIKMGTVSIHAGYQPYFMEYRNQMHAIGIDIALLNVPNGVQTGQFTTLHQARALGVKIPALTIAKSAIVQPL